MKTRLMVLSLSFLALLALPAFAVERILTLTAPATVSSGSWAGVRITASTTARDGEQIGFFHAEFSVDGGKTWVPMYKELLGTASTQEVNFQAGAVGTPAIVRVRVAFRGGKAGDVDFTGKPIAWGESWGKWSTPPAKQVTIPVVAR